MALPRFMRRFGDATDAEKPFADHLEPGEQLQHVAYGVRMPGCFASLLLGIFGGGAILNAASHYLVGLTNRRLIVLRIENVGHAVKNVYAWPLDALPPGKVEKQWLTLANPADPVNSIKAFLHPAAVPGHDDAVAAIAAALSGQAAPPAT